MKRVLSLAAAVVLVMGLAAPAFAAHDQLDPEKAKAFIQKECDRSGFSASADTARGSSKDVGNCFRDKIIGGFHFGPAGTDDKSTK